MTNQRVWEPTTNVKGHSSVNGLVHPCRSMTHGGKFTVLMSGALLSILPLLIVFFIAQKQFIEGISLTGIKR